MAGAVKVEEAALEAAAVMVATAVAAALPAVMVAAVMVAAVLVVVGRVAGPPLHLELLKVERRHRVLVGRRADRHLVEALRVGEGKLGLRQRESALVLVAAALVSGDLRVLRTGRDTAAGGERAVSERRGGYERERERAEATARGEEGCSVRARRGGLGGAVCGCLGRGWGRVKVAAGALG